MFCKYCDQRITYNQYTGWVHSDSKSIYCNLGAYMRAAPKRK